VDRRRQKDSVKLSLTSYASCKRRNLWRDTKRRIVSEFYQL